MGGAQRSRRDFGGQLEGALGERPRKRMAEGLAYAPGERGSGGRRGGGGLGPAGGAEDPGHLGEPPRPAAPRRGRELALDHAREDRLLPLGLDLVGNYEAALARLLYLERVALDRLGVEEPARHLGEREQLCRAGEEQGVGDRRGRRLGGGDLREKPPPAPRPGWRRGSPLPMNLKTFGHEAHGPPGLGLRPRELLCRAERE